MIRHYGVGVDFGDGTIVTSPPRVVGDAVVAAEPLRHMQGNAAIGGIWRVRGPDGSAVLKLATPPAPETADAVWPTSDEPAHWNYWRRESLAYETGLAATAYSVGITAPDVLQVSSRADGKVELWLADVGGAGGFDWRVPPGGTRVGAAGLVWGGGLAWRRGPGAGAGPGRAVRGLGGNGGPGESGRGGGRAIGLSWGRRGAVQQSGGEPVQHTGVDAAGHDRHDLRVAVITRARGRRPGPRGFGFGGAGQAAQPVQVQVQHDLGRLPGPLGQEPRPDQPPARIVQGVVQPLALGPQILRPPPLAQRIQHRLQRARPGGRVP